MSTPPGAQWSGLKRGAKMVGEKGTQTEGLLRLSRSNRAQSLAE